MQTTILSRWVFTTVFHFRRKLYDLCIYNAMWQFKVNRIYRLHVPPNDNKSRMANDIKTEYENYTHTSWF